MQQIVAQLLFGGDPNVEAQAMSPRVDMRLPPKAEKLALLEAQTHRRFIKTHLPADALVLSPRARYIYVARDGRDVVWSYYNHTANLTQPFLDRLNNLPGIAAPPMVPPPSDIRQFWRAWLDQDGHPFASFWDHVRSWWAIRNLPNVLLTHYTNHKRDLPGEARRVAAFLDILINEARWDSILEYCSFDWMKVNAVKVTPGGGATFLGGAQTFMNRGVNGRWAQTLAPEEIAEYEVHALSELGPDCAHWLATGEGS